MLNIAFKMAAAFCNPETHKFSPSAIQECW